MFPATSSSASLARRIFTFIVVGAALAALLLLLAWNQGWTQQRVTYTVRLINSADIAKNSPVMLNGIIIGRVQELGLIARDGAPVIEATFWVDGKHTHWLREGSLFVAESNLVTDSELLVTPGPAGSALLPPGSVLEGQVAPDLFDEMIAAQADVRAVLAESLKVVEALNASTGRFDNILAQVETQLAGLDEQIGAAVSTVQAAHDLLGQIQADEAAIAAELQASLATINGTLLPELTATVQANRDSLGSSLASVESTLTELERELPRLMDLTEETLANSRDFTEALNHTWPFSRYHKRKAKEAAAGNP